ncbi:MAG: single-stranded-DNA-specific exonuclease RecJ [Candidatus Goldbacteria bacterium]|nr:single-stranded-DNA-specific exonuclease RecJ [Candidatus Goldiibacteriota bacterium]
MKWVFLDNKVLDDDILYNLQYRLRLPNYLIRVFVNRGLDSINKIEQIFMIDEAHLDSPFLLEDMEKAVNRIERAMKNKEKIVIYGDYDVDGVTAIVILLNFFREYLDYNNIDFYIPHRQEEGYGLNIEAIKILKKHNTSLIITVDCGINAKEEIKYCNELGIDVIITDHHIPDEDKIPQNAFAIINPRVSKKYPDKDLSGVGVAYKLLCGLAEKKGIKIDDEFLDFVALGTVADIVPISNENRIIIRRGLKKLRNTENPGLIELKNIAGITNDTDISTYHIGYILGPRINAAGRIEHANQAVLLFISKNLDEIKNIAQNLNLTNEERKRQMKKIEEEAISQLNNTFRQDEDFIITLYNESWNAGIIGLVASRITKQFNRPTFVMTKSEDGFVHGSGRSIPSVNLYDVLKNVDKYLIKYGGHKLAAGISLKFEDIENFRKHSNDYLKLTKKPEDFEPQLFIDTKIKENINFKDIKLLEKLKPWGVGNPEPVFVAEDVFIKEVKHYKNNTMKFYGILRDRYYNFILYNCCEEDKQKIHQGQIVNIAFTPIINVWNGEEEMVFEVKDVQV